MRREAREWEAEGGRPEAGGDEIVGDETRIAGDGPAGSERGALRDDSGPRRAGHDPAGESGSRVASPGSGGSPPDGARATGRGGGAEACVAAAVGPLPVCCSNCAYSTFDGGQWLRSMIGGWPSGLVCANCADCPGRIVDVTCRRACGNYRPKRLPSVRLEPPEPPSDDIRYIPLTKGYFAMVDAADYEQIRRYKWNAFVVKGRIYARRSVPGGAVLMHRQIMNAPADKLVDHKEGVGLDNRRSNLRICDPCENAWNSRPRKASYKGVRRKRDKWEVRIMHRGRDIHVGVFDDPVEAARAHDRVARELHGEFAYLNFPEQARPENEAAR